MNLTDATLLQSNAFINGVWVAGKSTFDVTNPATGALVAKVADCASSETDQAISAAAAAQPKWAALMARERASIMRKWFDLIIKHTEDLAQLITAENGKPLAESRNEVAYGADFIDWYAEEGKRAYGQTVPHTREGQRFIVMRQAIGVVGLITPWNFPFSQVTKKLGAALAAGCAVVVKPAEQTPLSCLMLAELARRAGMPAGVVNVVPTSQPAAVGGALMKSDIVRKISFTGSTEVGKLLMRQAADTLKKVTLELGGNSPFIVFADADIDAAVTGVMGSKFRNAGQTCVCANRIFVHKDIYKTFVEKLLVQVAKLKLGVGTDAGITTGPLIDSDGFEKVSALVDDALAKGATALAGGKKSQLGFTFYEPTVIEGATPAMRIAQEEIFGPVLPLYQFTDEAEVVAEANNTQYGLAAYFYTRDYARVLRVSEALQFGVTAVNAGAASSEAAPFGGIKQSGFGKEGGWQGMDDYMVTKFVPITLA